VCAEINVTPFVDVALVLLILFMVAATPDREGYEVALPPAAASGPRTARESPVVALAADGGLTLGGAPVTLEGLAASLRARPDGPGSTVVFRADDAAGYGRAVAVLDRIRASGAAIAVVSDRPSAP
jgi:biopolymer transport protein ExbD